MDKMNRKRSASELKVLQKLQTIMARFPGVTEEIDGHGHSSFRVGKKTLCVLGEHEGQPSLGLKTDLQTQRHLISGGDFYKTPYVGQHGWVSIDGDATRIRWPQVAEVLEDTYRVCASAKLVKEFDSNLSL